jgi:zinc protease
MQFERVKIGGIQGLLLPRKGSGLFSAMTMLRRGSVDEQPGEYGLASFTMAMLLRGTRQRNAEQLAFDLESIGAMTGDSSGHDTGGLSVRAISTEATAALEMLFEALREPAFDPAQAEAHRAEVLADLRMQEDEKFALTYREYSKRMFAGHGYGHRTEGEPADVEKITPELCEQWHNRMIRPEHLLFVAAGEFDSDTLCAQVERLQAGWPAAGQSAPRTRTAPMPPDPAPYDFTKPAMQQGFIVAGFRVPTVEHEDYPALRLASAALGEGFGGRIFSELRDRRSLAYALGASIRGYRLSAHQVLYIGTKPESIEEARDGLLELAGQIRDELIGEDEMTRAREYVVGKILMGTQSLGQRVSKLAWWEDATGDAANADRYLERLKAVTREQIREAARKWWREPLVVVLRPDAVEVEA